MTLKLIASDMDGTLLDNNDGLTKDNAKALKQITDQGVVFCVASGRSLSGVAHILDRYDIPFCAILGNGSEFYNRDHERTMTRYFPKDKIPGVAAIFEEEDVNCMIFAKDEHYYSLRDPDMVREDFLERTAHYFHKDIDKLRSDPNAAIPARSLVKIDMDTLVNGDIDVIKMEAFAIDINRIVRCREKLKAIEGVSYLASCDDNVEVTDITAQKGLMLEEVIRDMGITKDEVIVLGDGMNDLSLFERFPYSYAPGNATDVIKAKAHKVVSSHTESDVKDAIEDFLKI